MLVKGAPELKLVHANLYEAFATVPVGRLQTISVYFNDALHNPLGW